MGGGAQSSSYEGVLFVDRLSRLKQSMVKKKLKKRAAEREAEREDEEASA